MKKGRESDGGRERQGVGDRKEGRVRHRGQEETGKQRKKKSGAGREREIDGLTGCYKGGCSL